MELATAVPSGWEGHRILNVTTAQPVPHNTHFLPIENRRVPLQKSPRDVAANSSMSASAITGTQKGTLRRVPESTLLLFIAGSSVIYRRLIGSATIFWARPCSRQCGHDMIGTVLIAFSGEPLIILVLMAT